jgi:hypothetical protein
MNPCSAGDDEMEPAVDQIFARIRASQTFVSKMECISDPDNVVADMKDEAGPCDDPVAEATVEIIEATAENGERSSLPGRLPKTLSEALAKHKNLDLSLSDCWKLLYYLRAGDQGADVEVLPKPLATRSCTLKKDQKWHNRLMAAISRLDAQSKQPAIRQSRQAAWLQHTEAERRRLAPTLPPALQVHRSDVVCVKVRTTWTVCLVISVFRNYAAKSGGAQLTTMPLPRGSLHSLRVVRALPCLYDIV